MASLLFWAPYMAHKGVMHQKREKQRLKNYERWEGLRDDYDEQRKISRESRSLDIQRTGNWDPVTQQTTGYNNFDDESRGIFTLRDQQEANDARTGWRPQEAWEDPRAQPETQFTGQQHQIQRHYSSTPAVPQQTTTSRPRPFIQPQKTGSTWDEGLPMPLQVSRRSFEDYSHDQRYKGGSAPVTRNITRQPSQSRRDSGVSGIYTPTESRFSTPVTVGTLQHMNPVNHVATNTINVIEQPTNEFGFIDPTPARPSVTPIAGGRMAELIERGY